MRYEILFYVYIYIILAGALAAAADSGAHTCVDATTLQISGRPRLQYLNLPLCSSYTQF